MIESASLHDLQKIMEDDFQDLIEIFIEDSVERLEELKYLLLQIPFDFDAIQKQAHFLKGSSGNVFAKQLHLLYYSLEKYAATKNLKDVKELVDTIDNETQIVFRELQDFNENL